MVIRSLVAETKVFRYLQSNGITWGIKNDFNQTKISNCWA